MINLSQESWEYILTDNDFNTTFNNVLNNLLRVFYSRFPSIISQYKPTNNKQKTKKKGKTSYIIKPEVNLISRNTNETKLRQRYKYGYKKCLLSLKKLKIYCKRNISNSNNPMKTTCNIIKSETPKRLVKIYKPPKHKEN